MRDRRQEIKWKDRGVLVVVDKDLSFAVCVVLLGGVAATPSRDDNGLSWTDSKVSIT